jgi:TRAP-type C4-dicarboxylate transport system substrate-binding protein
MKKKSTIFMVLCISLIFVSVTVSHCFAKSKKPTVLRLAGPWPPKDPANDQMEFLAEKFNKRAGGRYVIEVHPAESLVKVVESMDAVRTGAVEMAGYPIGMFASVDPRLATAEVPFLANNVEADAALQVETLPLYNEFLEKKFNQKMIFSYTCVALDLVSTKPVKTVADWKGLLTQSVSPQSAKFIEYMGGAPVAMPFPEAYQALQKGVVNASTQSSNFVIMFKLNEVAKYMTRGYLIPAALGIVINMDAFRKMPKDLQDLLVEVGNEQQKESNGWFCSVASKNTDILDDMGMEVYELPKAEREIWMEKVKPYSESLLEKMGPEFSQKVKEAAAKVNAKYPYGY